MGEETKGRWVVCIGACALTWSAATRTASAAEVKDAATSNEPAELYFASLNRTSSRFMLSLIPELGVQAGTETYELDADVSQPGLTETAASKLSYPVATTLAGGTLQVGIGRFSLGGTVLTNLVDPWGTLLDQDFLTASDGVQSESLEFSHTNSRTTLRTFDVEGALRARFGKPRVQGELALHGVVGFRFESSDYDAYGASGWQISSFDPPTQTPVSLPGDPLGLHYEVRYRQPFIGMGIELGDAAPFLFSAEARLLASWSSHDDNHILRNKLAHASAFGGGFQLSADPAFALGGFSAVRFFAGLHAQLAFASSFSGRLEQHYYGDDPSLQGDQTGQRIPDANFSFTSIRARLLAFVSARF